MLVILLCRDVLYVGQCSEYWVLVHLVFHDFVDNARITDSQFFTHGSPSNFKVGRDEAPCSAENRPSKTVFSVNILKNGTPLLREEVCMVKYRIVGNGALFFKYIIFGAGYDMKQNCNDHRLSATEIRIILI